MKIKLKSGNHEIEAEGSKVEVDQLLESWWDRLTSTLPKEVATGAKPSTPRGRPKRAQSRDAADVAESNFDPIPLTHAIKEDARHAVYQAHILHKKNFYNKIAL